MANIVNGTYFASYDDDGGYDEVPVLVDLDKLEVVSFGKAASCRWYEDNVKMCTEEMIVLADGHGYDAIKFDEYDDAVYEGLQDDYDRESIILFDNDKLTQAMAPFEDEAIEQLLGNYEFETCQPAYPAGIVSNARTAEDDVKDALTHMKRACDVMERSIQRLEGYQSKWGGYDRYIEADREMVARMKDMMAQMDIMLSDIKGSCA